jgi:glycosyltransferase involved in cell wall biosynthesis
MDLTEAPIGLTVGVSIVTVNYNNATGLTETISSVQSQSHRTIEHIVIDGGSSDGSADVLRASSGDLAFWSCEPDRGVYHAMNKGVQRATLPYVLFLNSGDCFNSTDALERLVAGSGDHDIVYGDLVLQEAEGRWTMVYPAMLTFDHFRTGSLPHPCSLIRRSLLSLRPYDEDLTIVADWAFFMNAICLHHASYTHVPYPIAVFRTDGRSSSAANQKIIARERETTLQTHYSAFVPDYRERDALKRTISQGWCRIGRKVDSVVSAIRQKLR